MRYVSVAWPTYRALIQSTIVSTAKPTRQKSSRGVNCGYTDFTSSLLVRFTPTIYPCSDQPLIQTGFWSAHRGKMYEGEYRQQLSIENRVCALTKNRVE